MGLADGGHEGLADGQGMVVVYKTRLQQSNWKRQT